MTYSHIGSWFMTDGPSLPLVDSLVFLFWQAHLQSFFMGLLFFVGGYFAAGSLARKGAPSFLRERFARLGVPALLFMAALHPLIVYGINPSHSDFGPLAHAYADYVRSGRILGGSGPMWFALALLGFSAGLALWHRLRPLAPAAGGPDRLPGPAARIAWVVVLVALTFLVRTVQPIGTSVLNMQLCFFPQYILAFAAGVCAARGQWLEVLARSSFARVCGWTALVLGPVGLAAALWGAGVFDGHGFAGVVGGWRASALGFAAWEQIAGVGLALGTLSFCARRLNTPSALSDWLCARSFGVYLLHPPVLVLLTLALQHVDVNAFFKVALLTSTGLAVSFGVADLARRIPFIRAII